MLQLLYRFALLVSPMLLVSVASFPQYTHRKVLAGVGEVDSGRLSLGGHYILGGLFGASQVFKDGEYLPPRVDGVDLLAAAGISDDGSWLSEGVYAPGPPFLQWRAIKDGHVVSPNWQSQPWTVVSGSNRLCADGTVYTTNGGSIRAAVLKDGRDFSSQWTNGIYDNLLNVTNNGKALWIGQGYGSSTIDLWFDGEAWTQTHDLGGWLWNPPTQMDRRVAANSSGHVVLTAHPVGHPASHEHVFRDNVDLTAAVFGQNPEITGGEAFINEAGNVLWVGGTGDPYKMLFINSSPIFGDFLAANNAGQGVQLFGWNDRQDFVWRGTKNISQPLYINSYNLTASASGTVYDYNTALDLNDSGQVLWAARNKRTQLWDAWLSSPVPEPACAVLLVIPCIRVMRRRGARMMR